MDLDQHRVLVKFSKNTTKMVIWQLSKVFGFDIEKGNIGFNFKPTWVLEQIFCSLVEVYEESDIVFVVGSGEVPQSSQRILSVIDGKNGNVLCEVQFLNTIKAIRPNLIRLVILLEDKIVVMKTENFSITGVFEVSNTISLI